MPYLILMFHDVKLGQIPINLYLNEMVSKKSTLL